jgi:hypothetical protein
MKTERQMRMESLSETLHKAGREKKDGLDTTRRYAKETKVKEAPRYCSLL